MKKLILISSLLLVFNFSAFAKTQGHQLGLDFVRAKAKHSYYNSGTISPNYSGFDDVASSFGLNYKYAVNHQGFFIAPGIILEHLGTKSKDGDGEDNISLKYRIGAKLDFGYDITNKIAAYVSAGYGAVDYKIDWRTTEQRKSSLEHDFFYGLGLSYNIDENILINFEYNAQDLTLDTPTNSSINQVETELTILKLGIAYRF